MGIAEWFGCDSVDGTFLAYGPDKNLPKLLSWLDELDGRPSLLGSTHHLEDPGRAARIPPPRRASLPAGKNVPATPPAGPPRTRPR
ncbi:hypothetical protein OG554_05250 [Streptomyces griseus]|uniref:hypothetical protein n=1 Tax=Streptomyces griseus TaxID=1911 RepID=UPI0038671EE6|nr:hypothetical protein OG554_05250 [Streptomyces fimicarius]